MNISIISTARSGSNWLSSAFTHESNLVLNEFFNIKETIFSLPNYIKENVDFNDNKIYVVSLINLIEIIAKKINHKRLPELINLESFMNYEILKKIQEDAKKINKNVITKFIHWQTEIGFKNEIEAALENSDFIIRMYRNNVLENFISLRKAIITDVWKFSNANIDKNRLKIFWKEDEYLIFYNRYFEGVNWIKHSHKHKKSITLRYEDIHENKNINNDKLKIDYLRNKIENAGINISLTDNYDCLLVKENQIRNLADNFINPNDFLKSYKNIPINLENI